MSFKSRLGDFCSATGTKPPPNNNAPKATTWKEQTEQLWRISQLSRGVKGNNASSSSSSVAQNRQHNQEEEDDDDNDDEPQRIHLAICICIVDSLPQEHIWKSWMVHPSIISSPSSSHPTDELHNNNNNNIVTTAELFIHAKHPDRIKSPWVKSKTISKSYRPEWNDVQIVRAMLHLATLASKPPPQDSTRTTTTDTAMTHVVFCTESCIPIATLEDISLILRRSPSSSSSLPPSSTNTNTNDARSTKKRSNHHHHHQQQSYLKSYSEKDTQCTRFDERECWDKLRPHIPTDAIHKSLPGWIVLCRTHVEEILKLNNGITNSGGGDDGLWRMFQNVWAPEEVFFPTALALCGHDVSSSSSRGNNCTTSNDDGDIVHRSLMHAKWDHRATNEKDRAHPLVYDELFSQELVERIRNEEGCVFMRKLIQPLALGTWEKIVLKRVMTTTTTVMEREVDSNPQRHGSFQECQRRDSSRRENGRSRYQDGSNSRKRYCDNNDDDRRGYHNYERDNEYRSGSRGRGENKASRADERYSHRYEPYSRKRR